MLTIALEVQIGLPSRMCEGSVALGDPQDTALLAPTLHLAKGGGGTHLLCQQLPGKTCRQLCQPGRALPGFSSESSHLGVTLVPQPRGAGPSSFYGQGCCHTVSATHLCGCLFFFFFFTQ